MKEPIPEREGCACADSVEREESAWPLWKGMKGMSISPWNWWTTLSSVPIIVISEYLGRGQWSKQARSRREKKPCKVQSKCSSLLKTRFKPHWTPRLWCRGKWRNPKFLFESWHLKCAWSQKKATRNLELPTPFNSDPLYLPGNSDYRRILLLFLCTWSLGFPEGRKEDMVLTQLSPHTLLEPICSKSPVASQTLWSKLPLPERLLWLPNLDLWSSKVQKSSEGLNLHYGGGRRIPKGIF